MSKSVPSVILASQSPYRRALLLNFGLKIEAYPPKIDEESLKRAGPREIYELTRYLAAKKAESLAGDFPEAVVLGSDQIADFNGERLDKPGSRDNTIAQLQRLQGKTHRLVTSLAMHFKGQTLIDTDVTALTMRKCDDQTLAAYVDQDHPWDCAGGYKIEKAGLALIESVETRDPSAIQGLPLTALVKMFTQLGIEISELWRKS